MKARWLLCACFVVVLWLSACEPTDAPVQDTGLAVLAQHADSYAQARPGQLLVFPRDHGAHPDYRIEWWYLTANLNDPDGNTYGIQWTLFRLAAQPPVGREPGDMGLDDQVFMAHFAVSTANDHMSFQRYAHGGQDPNTSRAGVTAEPFSAWMDDWTLRSSSSDWLPLEVKARQDETSIHLQLQSSKPLILQGENGFSQKHPEGGGSFYYSQPFLKASGDLLVNGQRVSVTGEAWLDREWSSQFLQGNQVGWDWFSIHLENGEKLMLFQLREGAGETQANNFLHGALISADGNSTPLDPAQIQMEVVQWVDVAGRALPLNWRMELPQIQRSFDIKTLHPDQWLEVDFPYWEGVIIVTGTGPQNNGRGYMELTGYSAR
jgi:predicted secreted hydrolase